MPTTIASLSDSRDKTNITNSVYGSDFVNTLRPFNIQGWRNLTEGDNTSVFNGNQEWDFLLKNYFESMLIGENEILDLVYDKPERLEAKYGNLIPILTKAIQDLSAANQALVWG